MYGVDKQLQSIIAKLINSAFPALCIKSYYKSFELALLKQKRGSSTPFLLYTALRRLINQGLSY